MNFCIRIDGNEGELHCPFCTVILDAETTFAHGCAFVIDMVAYHI